MQLIDERWHPCGDQICMSPAEAKKLLRNKAEMGRYMRETDNLIDYYRSQ